jgi:hypothetical protein
VGGSGANGAKRNGGNVDSEKLVHIVVRPEVAKRLYEVAALGNMMVFTCCILSEQPADPDGLKSMAETVQIAHEMGREEKRYFRRAQPACEKRANDLVDALQKLKNAVGD